MPIKKCQANNKDGKKWGDKGKCYTGSGATAKAARQGRAVKVSRARRQKLKWQ